VVLDVESARGDSKVGRRALAFCVPDFPAVRHRVRVPVTFGLPFLPS
jgi:hypothetical protein